MHSAKVRPADQSSWARDRSSSVILKLSVSADMMKIPTDALGNLKVILQFDPVRPQRPDSSLTSLFQIRVRGLEFD